MLDSFFYREHFFWLFCPPLTPGIMEIVHISMSLPWWHGNVILLMLIPQSVADLWQRWYPHSTDRHFQIPSKYQVLCCVLGTQRHSEINIFLKPFPFGKIKSLNFTYHSNHVFGSWSSVWILRCCTDEKLRKKIAQLVGGRAGTGTCVFSLLV